MESEASLVVAQIIKGSPLNTTYRSAVRERDSASLSLKTVHRKECTEYDTHRVASGICNQNQNSASGDAAHQRTEARNLSFPHNYWSGHCRTGRTSCYGPAVIQGGTHNQLTAVCTRTRAH